MKVLDLKYGYMMVETMLERRLIREFLDGKVDDLTIRNVWFHRFRGERGQILTVYDEEKRSTLGKYSLVEKETLSESPISELYRSVLLMDEQKDPEGWWTTVGDFSAVTPFEWDTNDRDYVRPIKFGKGDFKILQISTGMKLAMIYELGSGKYCCSQRVPDITAEITSVEFGRAWERYFFQLDGCTWKFSANVRNIGKTKVARVREK